MICDRSTWVDESLNHFIQYHMNRKTEALQQSMVYLCQYQNLNDSNRIKQYSDIKHSIVPDNTALCSSVIYLATHQCKCVVIDHFAYNEVDYQTWLSMVDEVIKYWCLLSLRYKMSIIIINRELESPLMSSIAKYTTLTLQKSGAKKIDHNILYL